MSLKCICVKSQCMSKGTVPAATAASAVAARPEEEDQQQNNDNEKNNNELLLNTVSQLFCIKSHYFVSLFAEKN